MRWDLRIVVAVFMAGAAASVSACPVIDGINPVASMKKALDYYPRVTTPQLIAGADCAMQHYQATRSQAPKFRAAVESLNYRYGRFLSEIADMQSKAAKRIRQTGGGTGVNYYKRDVEVRTALLKWCLGDKSACDVYTELGALANAYEQANQGIDLHDWMIESSPDSLVVKDALKIWLRAVYSCPAWDFHPAQDGNLYQWRETCSPGCVAIAKAASNALQEHGSRISSLQDQISDLVKSTKACESAKAKP